MPLKRFSSIILFGETYKYNKGVMKKTVYRVPNNQTLSAIASEFNIPECVIIKLNNLTGEVSSGDLLYIESSDEFTVYQVLPTDTLENLAVKFGVPTDEILSINGVPYIYAWQRIYLPKQK